MRCNLKLALQIPSSLVLLARRFRPQWVWDGWDMAALLAWVVFYDVAGMISHGVPEIVFFWPEGL
jgi:hypothetical protein